jgi:ribosomal protein L25 (general stress protein Ctc)
MVGVSAENNHAVYADFDEDFTITFAEDSFSAEIVNIPLKKVLRRIEAKTNIPIIILGPLEGKISVKIENLPLDKGIQKIVGKRANLLLTYSNNKNANKSRLYSIKIFAKDIQKKTLQKTQQRSDAYNNGILAGKSSGNTRSTIDEKELNIYRWGNSQDQSDREKLIMMLADPDPWIRESAARALAKIGGVASVDALIRALKDEDPAVRESAAYALGQIGDKRALTPLNELRRDSDEMVRKTVEYSLKQIAP